MKPTTIVFLIAGLGCLGAGFFLYTHGHPRVSGIPFVLGCVFLGVILPPTDSSGIHGASDST